MKPPKSPFVFVGGALALDFVNTEVIVRRQRRDLLETPEALLAWQKAASQHYAELTGERWPPTAEMLATAKHLRTAMRLILETRVAGKRLKEHDLVPLNHILQTGHHTLQVAKTGVVESTYQSMAKGAERALLPIALSAQWLLTTADLTRLRPCRNAYCILFFYDTTRSATRAWCSFGCLNRARSALTHERRKREAVA